MIETEIETKCCEKKGCGGISSRPTILTTHTGEPLAIVDTPSVVGRRWIELNDAARRAHNGNLSSAQMDKNFEQAKLDVLTMDEQGVGDSSGF